MEKKKILNSSPAEKNSHYILAGLPLPQKNILVLSSGGSSGEEKNLNHFSSRKKFSPSHHLKISNFSADKTHRLPQKSFSN